MKKMKKILAMLLALTMVFGMAMTVSAEQTDTTVTDTASKYEATITVNGLTVGESTTVNVYPIITLNAAENEWVIADWATSFVTEETDGSFKLDEDMSREELQKAATDAKEIPAYTTQTITGTVTTGSLPIGAYAILAAGTDKTAYSIMVAETYKEDETYMTAVNVVIDAKASDYEVKKEADDAFVGRGQEVNFTITTVFPSFEDPDATGNTYKIVDTPTGLLITGVVEVKVGSENETDKVTGAYDNANEKYTIDLTSLIGDTNANAGKVVTVKYKATVTADNGYSNTANAFVNDKKEGLDDEPDNPKGYTATLKITKKDDKQTVVLKGAEFKVKDSKGNVIKFVEVADEIDTYKVALADEQGATETLVSSEGVLKLKGLAEDTYTIVETKAPAGYSINEDIPAVTITADTKNITVDTIVTDTKLISLPSTGGIGTTIFTVAGCGIMIAAAYFFFASRKKESN